MKKSAQPSEWIVVGSLFAIMCSLLLIAKVNAYRATFSFPPDDPKQEEIMVTISGAVAKPGNYPVSAGTPVEEVVHKARPKPWANLQKIPLKQLIEKPLYIDVETLSVITVSVRGAVTTPLEITLPAKSRVCDLKSKVSLTAEADKTFFRRKRMLKNGEIIEVPKKTVE